MSRLTVITGMNGAGKTSLDRALRLLADCGRGEVIGSLARAGGLQSVLWAGPEQPQGARRTGSVEGTTRTRPVSLELGYASDGIGYLVDLGIPQSTGPDSAFGRDPEIKREAVFAGPVLRPGSALVRRTRDYAEVCAEHGRGFDELSRALPPYRSVVVTHSRAMCELLGAIGLSEHLDADPDAAIEVELYKEWGETRIAGQTLLTTSRWDWGKR